MPTDFPPQHGRSHVPSGYSLLAVAGTPDATFAAVPGGVRASDQLPLKIGSTSSVPWIALENLAQTLPDNTLKLSLHTDAWWDPAVLSGNPTTGGDATFSLSTAVQDATNYWVLTTKLAGWYQFDYISDFENTVATVANGYALIFVNFNTTGIHFQLDKNIRASQDWAQAGGEHFASPRVNIDGRRIYLPANKAWDGVSLTQVSGGARGVQTHLKVWYLGLFGGGTNSTWSFSAA